MRLPRLPLAIALPVLAWTLAAVAAEPQWTRFRGPNGCGVAAAPSIPVTWTDADYRWKAKLPGIGFGSPTVWEDRLYVTSTVEDQSLLIVLCLNSTISND